MIKKKHPKDRGERLSIKKSERLKNMHENASPVFKLLKQREEIFKDASKENVH